MHILLKEGVFEGKELVLLGDIDVLIPPIFTKHIKPNM